MVKLNPFNVNEPPVNEYVPFAANAYALPNDITPVPLCATEGVALNVPPL